MSGRQTCCLLCTSQDGVPQDSRELSAHSPALGLGGREEQGLSQSPAQPTKGSQTLFKLQTAAPSLSQRQKGSEIPALRLPDLITGLQSPWRYSVSRMWSPLALDGDSKPESNTSKPHAAITGLFHVSFKAIIA